MDGKDNITFCLQKIGDLGLVKSVELKVKSVKCKVKSEKCKV